jgi:hypothetical protein
MRNGEPSESTRREAIRADQSRSSRESEKKNPCHCAVCRPLIEPGKPGGVPGNALGFPSAEAGGPAHRVLDGNSFLTVLAQKKSPHHVHGRGSRYSVPLLATLAQAVPRCKPFLTFAAPCGRSPRCRPSDPATRRPSHDAATPQARRSARGPHPQVGEPPRRA